MKKLILAALAATWTVTATAEPAAILIRNARIFDGRGDATFAGDVLVSGNTIKRVSHGPMPASEATGAEVIEAAGRLLTPGFIDAHVHMGSVLAPDDIPDADPQYVAALEFKGAEAALMRGFTTQRDTGGAIWGLKRAIDEGLVPGPRVYMAGAVLSQTGGHGDDRRFNDVHKRLGGPLSVDERRGETVIADGVPEVLAATREQLRKGANFIKVLASGGAASEYDPLDVSEYTLDELRAAVEVATGFGTYVTVHSYNTTSTRRAIEAGVRCIEHGHLIDAATMRLMVERDVFLSTNLVSYETAPPGSTPRQIPKFAEIQAAIEPMMRLARTTHVKIAFGTDLVNGLEPQKKQSHEFALRGKWFAPIEVLKQATSVNAELLARSGPRNPYPGALGVIAEGAYADILLIDGDPLKDLGILEHPDTALALIMKDGRIYKDRIRSR
jgi:imidazolonepropionase-like amidohydrolase